MDFRQIRKFEFPTLESNVDATLDVSGGRGELVSRGTEGLLQQIPRIENRLNLSGNRAKRWKILGNADA